MLDRIHIQNYKCLRDVEIGLGDFTVLIGPNDSGKTSFLDAIRSLGLTANYTLGQVFGGDRSIANLVWRKDKTRRLIWEFEGKVASEKFTYCLELSTAQVAARELLSFQGKVLFETEGESVSLAEQLGQYQGPLNLAEGMTFLHGLAQQGQQPFLTIAGELVATVEYRFDPEKICQPSIPEPEPVLHPSGENLASVLEALRNNPDRTGIEALERDLHAAIPTLRGITLPPVRNGQGAKALEFILSGNGKPPVTIPARLASTGALLLTAFLALAHDQTPGLLLIEEPENGLHPSRLEMVINLLRQISRGEIGNRKRQVVVTTHSPLLLNYVKPEEVRVFVRHPEQGTKVTSMEKVPDIDKLLKEFATGELWYLLGEEKMFEGQPA